MTLIDNRCRGQDDRPEWRGELEASRAHTRKMWAEVAAYEAASAARLKTWSRRLWEGEPVTPWEEPAPAVPRSLALERGWIVVDGQRFPLEASLEPSCAPVVQASEPLSDERARPPVTITTTVRTSPFSEAGRALEDLFRRAAEEPQPPVPMRAVMVDGRAYQVLSVDHTHRRDATEITMLVRPEAPTYADLQDEATQILCAASGLSARWLGAEGDG